MATLISISIFFSVPPSNAFKKPDSENQPVSGRVIGNDNGKQTKPKGSGKGGSPGIPEFPRIESEKKSEDRFKDAQYWAKKMETDDDSDSEASESDFEGECENTIRVKESYLKSKIQVRVCKKFRQLPNLMAGVAAAKTDLEKLPPNDASFRSTSLGNGYYYVRKGVARLLVKYDPATRTSDILLIGYRNNTNIMVKFANQVNGNPAFDTTNKINPNAY